MKDITIFPVGIKESCRYASLFLEASGLLLTDHITPEITHLLLDIPSFRDDDILWDGTYLQDLLNKLPETVTIIGGNLNRDYLSRYSKIDLLQNPLYLAKNAAITAQCSLQVASGHLDTIWPDSPALILGWGRIGKCLSALLKSVGCNVSVAARSEADRAMLNALGFEVLNYSDIPKKLHRFRILFNTVPTQTVDAHCLNKWTQGVVIDLASSPGISCSNVITARGLPGIYAPESAGRLIAQVVTVTIKEASA